MNLLKEPRLADKDALKLIRAIEKDTNWPNNTTYNTLHIPPPYFAEFIFSETSINILRQKQYIWLNG